MAPREAMEIDVESRAQRGHAREQGGDGPSGSAFRLSVSQAQHRGVSLSFRNLSYKIFIGGYKNKAEKAILKNLRGYIPPSTFVAIMGPTGCGKTSLLNVLGGRVLKGGRIEGEVLVNGESRDSSFKRISAYVMQDDVLYHTLSVRETLIVAAKLRLPSSMPLSEKLRLVDSIITELSLNKAANTWIGNDLVRGVSGGERKRTNIAVELLSDPSLLFLDEPTSGLDSFQALNVMSTLKSLASSGRTVVCTIHQPRSSIFALCPNQTSTYTASDPSASDYFLDVISIDRRDEKREEESTSRVKLLVDSFVPEAGVTPPENPKLLMTPSALAESKIRKPGFASNWFTQFFTLFGRSATQVRRDKLPVGISFVQATVMGFIVAALFSEIGKGQKSIQDLQGVIFFISIFTAFGAVFQMITTFPFERAIVNRERAANAYRVSAFYPAKVISEWPLRIIPGMIFVTIVYFIIGLDNRAEKFFQFLLIVILGFTALFGVGLLIGSVAPTPQVALGLGPLVTVIFMLFGGFYINLENIPAGARWVAYCSPIMWMFTGAAHNQLDGAVRQNALLLSLRKCTW
ncbi:hypothetical protein CBR_g29766 [Chara braunii]|uniref:ABC transporter domain-containing protein n=1 Tax=Chara braunii TaxID=69332 RepID=A0A388LBB3_CHABU|nr:hypothetical protein CBR_g29766 [Chara braunii]|eukprot:GBG79617.1 hypothetical protein CBR_g29766 [Chara braunii]